MACLYESGGSASGERNGGRIRDKTGARGNKPTSVFGPENPSQSESPKNSRTFQPGDVAQTALCSIPLVIEVQTRQKQCWTKRQR